MRLPVGCDGLRKQTRINVLEYVTSAAQAGVVAYVLAHIDKGVAYPINKPKRSTRRDLYSLAQ